MLPTTRPDLTSWADTPPEVNMYRANNNRIEWVVEKENDGAWQFICGGGNEANMKLIASLLNAAQQSMEADVALCPVCQEPRPVVVMCEQCGTP